MSTQPSSCASSRAPSQRPTTPDHSKPTMTRTASFSVAPKSEYLRNALHARRAQQHTPTPCPLETRAPPSPVSKPSEIKTPKTSPDIFAEFALTEEQTTPVSPIRRRRPSDVGLPRSKTNRELVNEIEKLKEILMTSNMRVELLKKNNSELQHNMTKAKERLEELEPLEQENYDLQDENNYLKLKVENMEDELLRLKETNDDMRKTNEELTAIASESAEHWQGQECAIDEAAECIIKLEEEKTMLSNELKQLKERVTAIENTSCSNTLVDGSSGRYPTRVHSVDESRPSTSHFDSDYYSQPDSPQVQPSRESIHSLTPSERSKKFLDLSEDRRRSARDLVKRMSAASLKALSLLTPSPAPEVPQIPVAFQQQVLKVGEEDRAVIPTLKTPGRYRRGRQVVPQSLLDLAQISPVRANRGLPQSPAAQAEGLRGLYRPDKSTRSKTSNDSLPSSSHFVSPTTTAYAARRQISATDSSPRVPSRASSKHVHTSSSSEHLQRPSPRHRRQSEADIRSADSTPRTQIESGSSEWASLAPPPSVSVLSESDLTTEVDPREDKDRWWRSIDKLTLSQVMAQSQIAPQQAKEVTSNIILDARSPTGRLDTISSTIRPSRSGERKIKTTPSTPYHEKDFIFNSAEDEETFLRKTGIGGSRRQP
ncbi:Nn.00g046540.m01.CDS01 [Neocucurbitaria sp. VM-36]